MSETPEQRAKRTFRSHLLNFRWDHQITLFYQNYSDCFDAIDHSKVIRETVSREYPRHAFLWRLVLGRAETHWVGAPTKYKTAVLPYHTLLTFDPAYQVMNEEFTDAIEERLGLKFYGKKRSVTPKFLRDYAETVKTQPPHNFHRFFGLPANKIIRRFSLLNKKCLTPVWKIGMPLD
ncbi:hypothetical protein F6455_14690 [Proteobacteria bacterium 005FR1]|nr:hypothetical protein [Proteobacteria bacterium 005FR1]